MAWSPQYAAFARSLGMTGDALAAVQQEISDGVRPWEERFWLHFFIEARRHEFFAARRRAFWGNPFELIDVPAFHAFVEKRADEIAAENNRAATRMPG